MKLLSGEGIHHLKARAIRSILDHPARLSIQKALVGAIALCWWHSAALVKALALPGALLTVLTIITEYFLASPSTVVSLGFGIVNIAVFTVFAITCHRLVLLGERAVPEYGIRQWSLREWRFMGYVLVLYAIAIIIVVPVFAIGLALFGVVSQSMAADSVGTSQAYGWNAERILLVIPAVYVFCRLSLVLPATAIERPLSFKESWSLSRGNGWRLAVIVGLIPSLTGAGIELFWRDGATIAEIVFLSLLSLAILAVEIVALSLAYRELAVAARSQPPGV